MEINHKNSEVANQDPFIIFDGLCNLCCGFLQFVHASDPKWYFKFTWLQSDPDLLNQTKSGNFNPADETIILIENGIYYYRSTAFLKIVRHLRFPWPGLIIGYLIPVYLRDWLYDLVARNRYRLFGRREQCMLPDGALKDRFV